MATGHTSFHSITLDSIPHWVSKGVLIIHFKTNFRILVGRRLMAV